MKRTRRQPPPPGPLDIMTFVELRPDATPQGLELMRRYRDGVRGDSRRSVSRQLSRSVSCRARGWAVVTTRRNFA